MAARAQTGVAVPRGLNGGNVVIISITLAQALVDVDTLDVTLPANVDDDLVPMFHKVYSNATPAVDLSSALTVTNHNRTTGVTRFDVGAAGVADQARLTIWYGPANANS
jgi:hypothetical protein